MIDCKTCGKTGLQPDAIHTCTPVALRLAERLLQHAAQVRDSNGAMVYVMLTMAEVDEAAAELRRLARENEELRAHVEHKDAFATQLGRELMTAHGEVAARGALLRRALEALEDVDQIDTQEAVVIDVGDIVTAIRQHLENKA